MYNKKTVIVCKINPEHIDMYGHLNNSKYPDYFELGRVALQKEFSIEDETLIKDGIGFWTRYSSIKFRSQVEANQKEVEIHSNFIDYNKRATIYVGHRMISNGQEVATAVTEHCFVRLNKGKPKPIKPLEKLVSKLPKVLEW